MFGLGRDTPEKIEEASRTRRLEDLIPYDLPDPKSLTESRSSVRRARDVASLFRYSREEVATLVKDTLDKYMETPIGQYVPAEHGFGRFIPNAQAEALVDRLWQVLHLGGFGLSMSRGAYDNTRVRQRYDLARSLQGSALRVLLPANEGRHIDGILSHLYKLGLLPDESVLKTYAEQLEARKEQEHTLIRTTPRGAPRAITAVTQPNRPQSPTSLVAGTQKSPKSSLGIALDKETQEFLKAKGIKPFNSVPGGLDDLLGLDKKTKEAILSPLINRMYGRTGEATSGSNVVIFDGPAGTGKSYAAVALINQMGANRFDMNSAAIKNMYVGETPKAFERMVLEAARASRESGKLSVVLVDEAEVLFPHKGSDSHETTKEVMSLFNSYTSGPKSVDAGGVVFILTTNNLETMDPSVLNRAEIVRFEKPGAKYLEELIIQHTVGKGLRVDYNNIDWCQLAESGVGLVHRSVRKISERARASAVLRTATSKNVVLYAPTSEQKTYVANNYLITQKDLAEAIGAERSDKPMPGETGPMFA